MKKIAINLFFLFLFLASFMKMTDQSEIWTNIIYLLLGIVLVIQLFVIKGEFRIDYKTFIIIYCYVGLSGISSITNSDSRLFKGALLLLLLYYVSFVVFSSLSHVNINKIIYNTSLIAYMITVVVPLILHGVESIPYQGIFDNTNSLGILSASLFAVVSSVLLYNVESYIEGVGRSIKGRYIRFSLNIILLFFFFYLVILSGSRTSFIACIVIILIGFGHLLYYLIKEGKIVPFIIRGFLLLIPSSILMGIIAKFTSIFDFLNIIIIEKFQRKSVSGDVLASRGDIWIQTIKHANLFGHGGDYFNNTYLIGSHNTFINILGRYGWVPLILFVILIAILVVYSIKYSLANGKDKYKYMPLATCICFLTLSFAENISYSLIMIAMFFSVSSIIFSSNVPDEMSGHEYFKST